MLCFTTLEQVSQLTATENTPEIGTHQLRMVDEDRCAVLSLTNITHKGVALDADVGSPAQSPRQHARAASLSVPANSTWLVRRL